MSRQILLNHSDIRASVTSTRQFVEDYSALKEDLTTLEAEITSIKEDVDTIEADITALEADIVTIKSDIVTIQGDISVIQADIVTIKADITAIQADIVTITDNAVFAAYGAIAVRASNNIGSLDSTYIVVDGFDTDLITVPKNVTYDKVESAIALEAKGIWEFSIRISLTFSDTNAGRQIQVRAYNKTTGTAQASTYTTFVGRNQDGVNISLLMSVEVDESIVSSGDLIQLQIASAADTFSNVVNIATEYQVKHISEFDGLL